MSSKTTLILSYVAIIVFSAVLAGSTYGMGSNESDRLSAQYQAASSFVTISVVCLFVSLIFSMYLSFSAKDVGYSEGYYASIQQ